VAQRIAHPELVEGCAFDQDEREPARLVHVRVDDDAL
jgi:hypothetical protein